MKSDAKITQEAKSSPDRETNLRRQAVNKSVNGIFAISGQTLAIYPNRTEVKVDQLWSDDIEVTKVTGGENIKVKIKGVEEDQVQKGFVLCDPNNPIKSCKTFDAQVSRFPESFFRHFFTLRFPGFGPESHDIKRG